MGYASRLVPPSDVARAKALPLREPAGTTVTELATSAPTHLRRAWTSVVDVFVNEWFLAAMVSDRDLAATLGVTKNLARRKRTPGEQSPFSLADAGMLPDQHYHRFIADFGDLRRNFNQTR